MLENRLRSFIARSQVDLNIVEIMCEALVIVYLLERPKMLSRDQCKFLLKHVVRCVVNTL